VNKELDRYKQEFEMMKSKLQAVEGQYSKTVDSGSEVAGEGEG
jgi:hypothetical protein